jgi:vitamin B12 transporter
MFFREEELQVVSATRSLKPISRVAENMTVITAEDIERMNAHSLAEVLNGINGVQVNFTPRTPGNLAAAFIQGSNPKYVNVMIDGVPINNLNSNQADVGIIPVQNIDRIEIIKGPASSSWGSALGGIINIITKGPPDKGIRGMVSSSYGSNFTTDYRAEFGGRTGDVGLYVSGGGIHSNGFGFGANVLNNHIYSKFTYSPLQSTDLNMSLFYLRSNRGTGDFRDIDDMEKDKNEQYFGTVAITSRINSNLTVDVSGWAKKENRFMLDNFYSTGGFMYSFFFDDRRYGTSGKVTYKQGDHAIVIGADYDYGIEKADSLIDGKQHVSKWGVFANDTISIGNFAVTPGVRYDNTNLGGDFISPSLGATYQLTKKTVLRANVARGFYLPTLADRFGISAAMLPNPDLKVEKVWSYQVGAETAELKYVWLKASLFRHDIRDIIDNSGVMSVNRGKQRMQGFEAEMKTLSYYNIWASAGMTFADIRDLSAGQTAKGLPRYSYDVALNYDDKKSFKAIIRGRYIWWNEYDYNNAKYSTFIFDISAAKRVYTYDRHSLEIFGSLHNVFNDNQYDLYFYKNPRRWAEAGLRYRF